MNRVRYTTTRNKRTVLAETKDVGTADYISWLGKATPVTLIYPPAFVPLSAYGTRLRRIMLVLLDGARGLVIQLIDDFGVTGRANLLRLPGANLLSRLVERFTDVTGCARKSVRNLAGGLVGDVPNSPFRFRQHLGLASLQSLPSPGAFDLLALLLLKGSQPLVAPLHGGFGLSPTNQDCFLAICRGNERIDPQVNPNDSLLGPGLIGHFAHQKNCPHCQPGFHQAARQLNREGYPQRSSLAIGQKQLPVADLGALVGVGDVPVFGLAPGVAGLRMSTPAKLAGRGNRFTKLPNDLLDALGV